MESLPAALQRALKHALSNLAIELVEAVGVQRQDEIRLGCETGVGWKGVYLPVVYRPTAEVNRLLGTIVEFNPLQVVEVVRSIVEDLIDDNLGLQRQGQQCHAKSA